MKVKTQSAIAICMSTVLAAAAGAAVKDASTDESPFSMHKLASGYMNASGDNDKHEEGSCGEGSCGANDDKGEAEGSCGEGSCGASNEKDEAEGACGEGSCGANGKEEDD